MEHENRDVKRSNTAAGREPGLQQKLVLTPAQVRRAGSGSLPGVQAMPDGRSQTQLGSGAVTSLISRGGMAYIYEIWNSLLEVKRAVKVLRPDHSDDSAQRFETEMKISAKLHHPNIVEIYAVGKWNGLPYIEMEEVDGSTVEDLIKECGSLPVEVCVAIGLMVGRALNHAHNQKYVIYGKEYHGVIHRDLKPSNIMVTHKGVVKLMDFGIAKPTTASLVTCGNDTVVGTLQYLAPEQLEGSDIDVRVDIYSLGAVMYEMLTGTRAFPHSQLALLVPDKLKGEFEPLDTYDLRIPPALKALIHRCLHVDRDKRIPDALAYLRTLGEIQKKLTADSPEQTLAAFMWGARDHTPVSIRKKPRGTWWVWAALGGIAAILLLLIAGREQLRERIEEYRSGDVPVVEIEKEPDPPAPAIEPPVSTPTAKVPASAEASARETPKQATGTRKGALPSSRPERIAADTRKGMEEASIPQATEASAPSEKTVAAGGREVAVSEKAPTATSGDEASLLARLQARYRTRELVTIMAREDDRGEFDNVLSLYAMLDPSGRNSTRAVLLRLRALKGVGDKKTLRKELMNREINDGEFLLQKAEMLYASGDYDAVQKLLARASSLPSELMDAALFRQKLLYSKAVCATAVFNNQPQPETKKRAMAAWFNVKSLLRTTPEHRYYQRADAEIRRISKL